MQIEGVLGSAVEAPHPDGAALRAAEDALAVGHRRQRDDSAGVEGTGLGAEAHKALGGDAPHLDAIS